jgi:2-polyprenyl-3-methyl-5-hydroxy-6-metoxy-1,4-benzoquinol methylase
MNQNHAQQRILCPLCSGNVLTKLPADVSRVNNLLCNGCGLVFQPTIDPRERSAYYHASLYHTSSANRSVRRAFISPGMLRASARKRMLALEKRFGFIKPGLRILDIGCGYGALLAACRDERQCKVTGIEPAPSACSTAKEWFGLTLIEDTFEEAEPQGPFDRITAIHTIEHTNDPVAFLKHCGDLLTPDGLLYIECPNLLRPTAGFPWPRFLEKDHLCQFTNVTMRMAAVAAGLNICEMDDRTHLRAVMNKNREPAKVSINEQTANAAKVKDFIEEYPRTRIMRLYPLRRSFFLAGYIMTILRHKIADALAR